VKEKFNA